MSAPPGGNSPEPVSVSGGAGGIGARYDDMIELARRYGRAATDVGGAALRLHGYFLDPALYSSGLLDPVGLGRFEASLGAALDGPHGLATVAVRCGERDAQLRLAVRLYRTADRLGSRVETAYQALTHAPGALRDSAEALGSNGRWLSLGNWENGLDTLLAHDPELADLAMTAALPYLAGVSLLYPDGHAALRALGTDPGEDAGGPPRSLAAVVAGLARRDRGRHGEIDVRRMTGADGKTYVIVDIPGTKSWSPSPVDHDITGVATNLRAVEGQHTSYEDGVLKAMHSAGVLPTDQVMLVGHSQGGMVAVKTAIDCAKGGEFTVADVVTAGAPIGATAGQVPVGVQVLALENTGDVVPHLDGVDNPDRSNITTVTVHHDHGELGENHSIGESYLPGAADVDASDDPSIRAFLSGAAGFFTATSVQTQRYVIAREY